jgi:hypothetical protein
MKRSPKKSPDSVAEHPDWLRFSMHAQMRVWNSGGPIHAPHRPVLQLLIQPWQGNHESWTVYRHGSDARRAGKLVGKLWDQEADSRKVLSLGRESMPKDWHKAASVTEWHFPLSARWVRVLEGVVEGLSVPPIAGPARDLGQATEFKLSFWRGMQQSHFSWHSKPPGVWKPLAALFSLLLEAFRQHARGLPIAPVPTLRTFRRKRAER